MAALRHLLYTPLYMFVPPCNSNHTTGSQDPTPLRFPVWLGIPKPMIPYPPMGKGAVQTVGSHGPHTQPFGSA